MTTLDLTVKDANQKKEQYIKAFEDSFDLYEALFAQVKDEGLFIQADPLRHPLIFYLAHTSVFYVNKFITAGLIKVNERINPTFESKFAVGVDEMSWDDKLEPREWPAAQEIRQYRDQVRAFVIRKIKEFKLEDNSVIDESNPFWPVSMGIEHEKIHLETTSVLIRQLPLKYIQKDIPTGEIFKNICLTYNNDSTANVEINYVQVPKGSVTIGRPSKRENAISDAHKQNLVPIYGWDNEFGHHSAEVEGFKVQDKLVSNSQYLRFVNEDGYSTQEYWSEEGWKWATSTNSKFPKFWVDTEKGFRLRLMLEIPEEMPWDWPVEVNCLEANAYCRWLSKKLQTQVRLPTEDEYNHVLRRYQQDLDIQKLNIELRHASSSPVNSYKVGDIYDLMGNVWQWTVTPIYPFDGFQVHPIYDDFSTPTFDDKHNLFKGGSWISMGNEATVYSRYAFRRHFFQHAGFRTIIPDSQDSCKHFNEDLNDHEDKNLIISSNQCYVNPYESDDSVNLYCNFHFGERINFFGQLLPNFPTLCSMVCEKVIQQSHFWQEKKQNPSLKLRALDLGCAVGKTTFDFSRFFDESVGVDFSVRFIQVASILMKNKQILYKMPQEGHIYKYKQAFIKDFEDYKVELDFMNQLFTFPESREEFPVRATEQHILFQQGDACNLPEHLGKFHLIMGANLIDRLYDPEQFLKDIVKFIEPRGFLVLYSPYTWLQEYTPKEKWIGGRQQDGENLYTRVNLTNILSEEFEPYNIKLDGHGYNDPIYGKFEKDSEINCFSLPFSIQETLRKHQFTYSECTIWQRKH